MDKYSEDLNMNFSVENNCIKFEDGVEYTGLEIFRLRQVKKETKPEAYKKMINIAHKFKKDFDMIIE